MRITPDPVTRLWSLCQALRKSRRFIRVLLAFLAVAATASCSTPEGHTDWGGTVALVLLIIIIVIFLIFLIVILLPEELGAAFLAALVAIAEALVSLITGLIDIILSWIEWLVSALIDLVIWIGRFIVKRLLPWLIPRIGALIRAVQARWAGYLATHPRLAKIWAIIAGALFVGRLKQISRLLTGWWKKLFGRLPPIPVACGQSKTLTSTKTYTSSQWGIVPWRWVKTGAQRQADAEAEATQEALSQAMDDLLAQIAAISCAPGCHPVIGPITQTWVPTTTTITTHWYGDTYSATASVTLTVTVECK